MSTVREEGVFKAYEEKLETRGAVEVQEDEDLQVELPVDQKKVCLRHTRRNLRQEEPWRFKKMKTCKWSFQLTSVDPGRTNERQAETVDEEDDVEETLKDEDLVEDNKWESQVHGGQEADGSTEEDTVASWSDHEEDLINDNEEEPPQETPEEPSQETPEDPPQETPEEPSQVTPEEPYQEMPELEEEESRKSCSPLGIETPSSPESQITSSRRSESAEKTDEYALVA
ncbi:UNVERIFIED_CONTAM: hypothetical protein FKN15_047855 [Acipenser sinensis]